MYARSTGGKTYHLGVSGSLWKDALVMYDRETGTLWSQFNGEAIRGQELGKKLEQLPSRVMTWGQWRRLHPGTLVLEKPDGPTGSSYARYASDPEKLGIFGSANPDGRLSGKEWVVGVARDGGAVAFSHAGLEDERVATARVGGETIVAARSGDGGTVAYLARAMGRELDFTGAGSDPRRAADATTGTVWDLVAGEAVEGPMKGAKLKQVPATDAYWFAWAAFYPRTGLWTGGS